MQTERKTSVVKELDEYLAPLVFLYMFGVVAALFAVLVWVYHTRGFA